MSLWITNHAAITQAPSTQAITDTPQQSRIPAKSNHETNHANHVPAPITFAPLFNKGASVCLPFRKAPHQ